MAPVGLRTNLTTCTKGACESGQRIMSTAELTQPETKTLSNVLMEASYRLHVASELALIREQLLAGDVEAAERSKERLRDFVESIEGEEAAIIIGASIYADTTEPSPSLPRTLTRLVEYFLTAQDVFEDKAKQAFDRTVCRNRYDLIKSCPPSAPEPGSLSFNEVMLEIARRCIQQDRRMSLENGGFTRDETNEINGWYTDADDRRELSYYAVIDDREEDWQENINGLIYLQHPEHGDDCKYGFYISRQGKLEATAC